MKVIHPFSWQYTFLTKSAKPRSLTLRPHRAFEVQTLKAYLDRGQSVGDQLPASRWFAILGVSVPSQALHARLPLPFFFREVTVSTVDSVETPFEKLRRVYIGPDP